MSSVPVGSHILIYVALQVPGTKLFVPVLWIRSIPFRLTDEIQQCDISPWTYTITGASCGLLDSCNIPNSLNSTLFCGQGNVPQYAVLAQTQDHIVAYVNFAVKYNLRSASVSQFKLYLLQYYGVRMGPGITYH